jgi:conjugal transfer pilus assembly protein TraV
MSRFLLRAAMAVLMSPLAACMNMSGLSGASKYACAAPEGVACESVSGVYANAIHDNLPSQRRGTGEPTQPAPSERPSSEPTSTQERLAPTRPLPPAAALEASVLTSSSLRSQARYLRLWIKPWEDLDGDLFDQAHVYVQVDLGRWQIEHLRQRIRERYAPLKPPVSAGAPPQRDWSAGPEPSPAWAVEHPTQHPTQAPTGRPAPSLAPPAGGPVGRPQ